MVPLIGGIDEVGIGHKDDIFPLGVHLYSDTWDGTLFQGEGIDIENTIAALLTLEELLCRARLYEGLPSPDEWELGSVAHSSIDRYLRSYNALAWVTFFGTDIEVVDNTIATLLGGYDKLMATKLRHFVSSPRYREDRVGTEGGIDREGLC